MIVLREMHQPPEVVVVPNPIGEAFEAPLDAPTSPRMRDRPPWPGLAASIGSNWRSFLRSAARASVGGCLRSSSRIAGGGAPDEEAAFERRCLRSGVVARLRWLRGQPHATMPHLYDEIRARGGVVISTSRGDSFGMAVAEAMARGCAVVAPRLGPFTEFITDGIEGRLYRPGMETDAADAVSGLLADDELRSRVGAKARIRILDSHATGLAMRTLAQALQTVQSRS